MKSLSPEERDRDELRINVAEETWRQLTPIVAIALLIAGCALVYWGR